VFVYRRKERAGRIEPPSYRTLLYPITPLLFILVVVAIVVSDLSSSGWRAAAGVIIAALGFPFSYLWTRRKAAGLQPAQPPGQKPQ
ncbi:MAG TPA: hypothetical protein VN539_02435, partial [Candidatus Saccharimonadales bacterium]|nr:hypothetical protein [Candidatus Saccharimonadales bacterium]